MSGMDEWQAIQNEKIRLMAEVESGIAKKIAEIARLRAALEEIAGPDPEPTLDEPDMDWEVVVKLRAIASAALSNGHQGGVT